MGAKDPETAKAAKAGADGHPDAEYPEREPRPVLPCQKKHWIAVRVEFEDGKLVENGILMRLKLNNGETRDVTLHPGRQPDGKYSTGYILDLTSVCEVTFPDMYDVECKPR